MEERLKKLEGKVEDLGFQVKDFRDFHSPFNIEQMHAQIEGLNNRTLVLDDRVKMLEDRLKDIPGYLKDLKELKELKELSKGEPHVEGDKPIPMENKVDDSKDELVPKEDKKSKKFFGKR